MADTKISALPAAGAAADANELAINEAGTSKKVTAAQLKTLINTAPAFAAGSASANTWPKLTAGTLLTTPEDGALEMDATNLYATTDPSNRGYIPLRHFIRCNTTRTLPNDTNLNAIFNDPANGRLTLETGVYLFESILIITTMSSSSGNALINLRGAGTATVDSWLWALNGIDNSAAATLLDDDAAYFVVEATAASAVTAGTGTALRLQMAGSFKVTAAGTFIPSIDLVTAAAAVVSIGSYFLCERMGSTTVASVGQWD